MADLERAYLHYILTGDEKNLSASLQRAEHQAAKTEASLSKTGETAKSSGKKAEEGSHGFGKLGAAVGGIGKLGVAALGIGGLAFGIKDVISAGQAWQGQQAQLRNALKNTGNAGKASLQQVNDAIDKLATSGGFNPAQQVQAFTQLIRATGSVTKATRDEALATNIARGTHKDFLVVSKAVALVEQGRTTGLSRLGIVLPKITAATDALKASTKKATPEQTAQAKATDAQATKVAAITRLTKLYGGSMGAFGKTSQGAISNVHNALDILNQRLGSVFLPLITRVANGLSGLLGKAIHWIDGHRQQIDSFLKAIKNAFVGMWNGVKPVLGALVSAIGSVARWLGQNTQAAKLLGGVLATVFVASKITGFFKVFTTLGPTMISWLGRMVLAVNPLTAAIAAAAGAYLLLHRNIVLAAGSSPQQVSNALNKQGAGFATQTIVSRLNAQGAFQTGQTPAQGAAAVAAHGHHYMGGLISAFSSGGPVGGPGSYRDTVPAMLEPGEFVLRKGAVDSLGVKLLNSINTTGRLAPGHENRDIVINHRTYLGRRVIAEQVTRHTLEMAARR